MINMIKINIIDYHKLRVGPLARSPSLATNISIQRSLLESQFNKIILLFFYLYIIYTIYFFSLFIYLLEGDLFLPIVKQWIITNERLLLLLFLFLCVLIIPNASFSYSAASDATFRKYK